MNTTTLQLTEVLREEIDLYRQVNSLEENKSDMIIDRNGSELERISLAQESLLNEIHLCESRREGIIAGFVSRHPALDSEDVTLRDIAAIDETETGENLLEMGMELKDLLVRMQALLDTNNRLIQDHVEYYNILVTDLKSRTTIESGYGSTGREEGSSTGSILFNETV